MGVIICLPVPTKIDELTDILLLMWTSWWTGLCLFCGACSIVSVTADAVAVSLSGFWYYKHLWRLLLCIYICVLLDLYIVLTWARVYICDKFWKVHKWSWAGPVWLTGCCVTAGSSWAGPVWLTGCCVTAGSSWAGPVWLTGCCVTAGSSWAGPVWLTGCWNPITSKLTL